MVDKPKRTRRRSKQQAEATAVREAPSWGHATSVAPNAFTRWMDHHGFKAAEVAGMIGVSRAAVYDLRRRLYLPRLDLANRIALMAEQIGGPAVPPTSWTMEPTPEDLAQSEIGHAMAMRTRSSRRLGKRGTRAEAEQRLAAESLPPASILLALPPNFDEED